MRLIQNYIFKIGTKIPYSQWPEIVHQFLQKNNLTSHRFLYYFDNFVNSEDVSEGNFPPCGCTRILKDCPVLGDIRHCKGMPRYWSEYIWLSNIDSQEPFAEDNLLPLMKKIHRTYGFCSNSLYYFDIDFFGKKTHFGRDLSIAKNTAKKAGTPLDPTFHMEDQPYGSGITLHRDICADNYLKLSIDILHDGVVLDATSYYRSMQALLPGIKGQTSLHLYVPEEEHLRFEEICKNAEPMLQQCRNYLEKNLVFTHFQNAFPSNYSLAKPLKKLAKKYGYTYELVWNGGVFSLSKRTPRGNVIYIEVDSGPSHYNLDLTISFQGVGFHQLLGRSGHAPINQEETDAYLESTLSAISKFESTLLPALDVLFPECPSWFIPTSWPEPYTKEEA